MDSGVSILKWAQMMCVFRVDRSMMGLYSPDGLGRRNSLL